MINASDRPAAILGASLALGLAASAAIFGSHARHIGSGKQSISVKGLAEKPITADYAEWTIGVTVLGPTFAEALDKLRRTRPQLDSFLKQQGFDNASLTEENEEVEKNMVEEELPNGRSRTVQKGFSATQDIRLTSKDLPRVASANKAALQLKAKGVPVVYEAPRFLVSNLEDIKMSLIGAATQNARRRAEEFAKNGGVKAGSMRSASQGAFYILPVGESSDSSEYGGTYDKTTADKTARVVVTIEYAID